MKNKLRKIVVQGQTFTWRYQPHMRSLPPLTSRLLVFDKDSNITIEIFFASSSTWTGGNPLQEGMLMEKDGEPFCINLNRPRYVGELVAFVLDSYSREQLVHLVIEDGQQLLLQMGYRQLAAENNNL